jgi:DNA-binding Xre family transcriptional regulator
VIIVDSFVVGGAVALCKRVYISPVRYTREIYVARHLFYDIFSARRTTMTPVGSTYDIRPHLRAAFARQGRSQAEIARRAELTWGQVWRLLDAEQGTGRVSSDTLRRLCLALECSADELLGLTDSPRL